MRVSAFERTAVVVGSAIAIVTIATLAVRGTQSPAPRVVATSDRVLTFFVADGDPRTGFQSSDRELAGWAFDAWQAKAAGGFTVATSQEPEARVRLYWPSLDDGMFGETRTIVVSGRPGAAVFVRTDMTALGSDIARRTRQDPLWRDTIVYLTCLHELGHALGLEHTADMRDIMYYFGYGGDIDEYFARYRRQLASRNDIRRVSGLSDADVQRLRTLHR